MDLIERFDKAAQAWGWQSEEGHDGAAVSAAQAEYIAAKEALISELYEPQLKQMRFENGQLNMELVGHAVANMATLIAEHFRASGAQNYIEMNLSAKSAPFERYCVYVQKVGAKSPHDLRLSAETTLSEVMGWIKNWDAPFLQDDEWPETEAKVKAVLATP